MTPERQQWLREGLANMKHLAGLRAEDEEMAEMVLRPLRAETHLGQDLVDFLVQRVAAALLLARLEGRRDREFELAYEMVQARTWAGRIKTAPEPAGVLPVGVNTAARELLFLAGIEGISTLSRGGKGCVFRALDALRPDIAKLWAEEDDPAALLRRFYPEE